MMGGGTTYIKILGDTQKVGTDKKDKYQQYIKLMMYTGVKNLPTAIFSI